MLSKPLMSWLLDEPTDAKAIDVIAKSDLLRSEATMALPALRAAALRPATQAEIKSIIGSRFATYPQPKRNEGEAAAFWADYFAALDGLAPAQIEAGMGAHVKDPKAEFLPKPGRLADLARTTPSDGKWTRAHNRARAAVEASRQLEAPKARDDASRPTPEELKAVMATFKAKMAALEPPQTKVKRRASPQARVDGAGMSPEARALLERQGTIAPRHQEQDRAA